MATPFVRPDVRAFLDSGAADRLPPMTDQVIAMIRQMDPAAINAAAMMDADAGEIAVRRDLTVDGPGGPLPLRLYDARAERGPGPVVVYAHGGGFVLGSIALFDALCCEMARTLDLPVVSVEYRLAPEQPFPAAPDDCEAAARIVAERGAALFDRAATGLVLAGDSAGANLAIVTALALRDRPAAVPAIALFALYPALGRAHEYPSFEAFGEGYMLSRASMDYYGRAYAADESWRGRPADADMTGLPPSLIVTASLDPLRDEGRALVGKLAAAGVPVVFREAAGQIHGFAVMRRVTPSAAGELAGALAALNGLLADPSGGR